MIYSSEQEKKENILTEKTQSPCTNYTSHLIYTSKSQTQKCHIPFHKQKKNKKNVQKKKKERNEGKKLGRRIKADARANSTSSP